MSQLKLGGDPNIVIQLQGSDENFRIRCTCQRQ